MEKTRPITYIAFITAMLLWSFSFIWSKQAFSIYSPFTVLFFRLLLATLSIIVIAKLLGVLQKIKKGDYKLLILLSFFEPFLYFIGENFGLDRVSPTVAAVMISMIPIGMPFLGKYFFNETISKANIIGLLISIGGVLMIILEKNLSFGANPLGIALLLLAVFSALAYTVILKKVTKTYNAFTIVSWQNVFATIGFLVLFLIFEFKSFSQIGFDWKGMKFILLLAIICSNGAFLLFTYGMKRLSVAKAGVFTNLIPIFTAALSLIILHEQLNHFKYIGIGLVVVGLMISQINAKKAH